MFCVPFAPNTTPYDEEELKKSTALNVKSAPLFPIGSLTLSASVTTGSLENITFPPASPVSSVSAAFKFAEVGLARKVAMPLHKPAMPVVTGNPVQDVNEPENCAAEIVPEKVAPDALNPPLKVSSRENAPVVPLKVPLNVKPPAALIPAENVFSAVKIFVPPTVTPVTAPVSPLNV